MELPTQMNFYANFIAYSCFVIGTISCGFNCVAAPVAVAVAVVVVDV